MNLFAPCGPTPPQDRREFSIGIPVSSALSGVGITKHKIKKLDAIARANHPDGRKAPPAYTARPFVLCGIPLRRPQKHSLQ